MRRKTKIHQSLFLIFICLLCSLAHADEFEFQFDNDIFAVGGLDRWYSNGVKISMGTSDANWSLGHEMYTPRDKRASEVIPYDRPYDGYIYASRQSKHGGEGFFDRPELRFGCVGSCSGADKLQRYVHRDLGLGTDPMGWHNMNPPEPTVEVLFSDKKKVASISPWELLYADLHVGETLRLGTVETLAQIEAEANMHLFQIGKSYVNLVSGAQGRLVAYNTHLDGRLFQSNTHTVTSVPWVVGTYLGLYLKLSSWNVGYKHTWLTDEFKTQDGRHSYGSITIEKAW